MKRIITACTHNKQKHDGSQVDREEKADDHGQG